MKATLQNYRQSPRKVRLVTDLIKGKKVADAKLELAFLAKRASEPLEKLLDSAIANAKNNFGIGPENLIVKNIQVDKGIVLKRFMPRARGSASRINKRTSHVVLILEDTNKKIEKPKAEAVKAEVKKVKAKAPAAAKAKAPAKAKAKK
jgi:large subunit ribosomal protein L22